MSNKSEAVKLTKVSKSFGSGNLKIKALDHVDFSASYNELLMIVGPSGCGKTTLLSVLAATLAFDEGRVEVLGNDLSKLSDREKTVFRRDNIGFIFQQLHLIPTLNCVENISIPLLLKNYSKKAAFEKSSYIMEQLGLKNRELEFPKNLSGGQQQRVAIARALVHNPRLIVCDEPTSALDAESGKNVVDLLAKISREGDKVVLVVTHDNRIFDYADRMIKMDDGKIV